MDEPEPKARDAGSRGQYDRWRMVATMAEREPADFLERSARLAGVGAWQFDLASRRLAWAGPMWQLFDLPPDEIGRAHV